MPAPPLTYAFKADEKTSHGFVRVLRAISVRARGLARRSGEPTEESIHDLRVLIKRTRALLWFARPALAEAAYAGARTQLRKAAQLLAGQRDFAVTESTLEMLAKKASKSRDRAAVRQTFQGLVCGPGAQEARKKPMRPALKKAVEILRQAADEAARNAADSDAWPSPSGRVAKAFRATRRAGIKARRTGRDVDFHTWRKKAKRLFYQLELSGAEPGRRKARALKQAGKLQDSLGAYHDCVVVEAQLRRTLPLPPAERRVANLLAKRKARLRKLACKITRRLDDPARCGPD